MTTSRSLHSIKYQDLFSGLPLAKPLELKFTKNKRIVVISDCHLSSQFDEDVYKKLIEIAKLADILVLNGDFWADSSVRFDKFITSKWQKFFPILLKKETYYVFGNHDMPLHSDERIYSFCKWAGFRLKIKAGDISLHIEHGHLLSGNFVRNILTIFQKHPTALKYATLPFGLAEDSIRYFAQKTGSTVLKKLNMEFKISRLTVSKKDEYFLMGHTHVPEFDEETRYVNSGLTHMNHFDYIEIYMNKIHVASL